MKKKIVACLLCMAMGVSTMPMPMVQAAVVYDETTGEETAEDKDGDVEAKDYIYTAITEGLKASADCGNGNGTPTSILNDNQDDYWHSALGGDDQPVRQGGEVVMNSKNNITLTLSEASAVKKLEYVSGGESSNGTITKCNIYYKTSDENAEFQKVQEEPYTLNFTDARATIEFAEPLNDVKEIKIEVLNTAGDETNTFISGKELYIYSDDNTKVDSSKITAKAECSSQQGQEVKYFVDDDESTKYHSSWTWQGNYSTEEGFTEIVRPGTTTVPTELVSKNNLYINLTESKTVGKLTYLPRQGEESGTENGRITTANIYVSNSDAENVSEITDWKLVTTANWENSTDEKEVTFSPEMAKHIRIEVKHSAGSTADTYINAAKIGVYEAEEVPAGDTRATIEVTDGELSVPEAKKGEKPGEVTTTGTGYRVATKWYEGNSDKELGAGAAFEAGKSYTVKATLTVENETSSKFDDTSKPKKIKIGETEVNLTDSQVSVSEDGKSMTVSYSVTMTKDTIKVNDGELSVPEAKKGEKPGEVTTTGTGYRVATKWYEGNSDKELGAGAAFEAGKSYTVKATLTVENETSSKFDDTSKPKKIKVGETEVDLTDSQVSVSEDGKSMTVSYSVTMTKDTIKVNDGELSVPEAKKGEKPGEVTTTGTGYSVDTKWYKGNSTEELGAGAAFEAGKSYTVKATLTVENETSSKFDDTSKPKKIKVGETEVDLTDSQVSVSEDGKSMTVSYSVTMTKDTIKVNDGELSVPEAKKGEKPGEVTTTGTGYSVDTKWYKGNSTEELGAEAAFEAGKSYTVKATLTVKDAESSKFDDTSKPKKIKVGGTEVDLTDGQVSVSEDGKSMTVSYSVTMTKDTIKVNDGELSVPGATEKGKPGKVTTTGTGYRVDTKWYEGNSTEELRAEAVFEAGKSYTVKATLTVNDAESSKFDSTIKPIKIKVGETDVELTDNQVSVSEDGKSVTVSYTFSISHTYGEWIKEVSATCEKAGVKGHYHCNVCGKDFDADKKEIKDLQIPAKGHTITKKETPATADREGKIEYSCDVCKNYVEKTFILPKTEISVYMGKTANLISDASRCSITLANAKKYKKYFTLDTKTGKIKTSTKKLSKVKIKKTIPVKVTVDGKAYNVNVKLKIAAPKITIKRLSIKIGGIEGYRYKFKYNIKGAKKIRVRVKNMKTLNAACNKYLTKPRNNSQSFLNVRKSSVKGKKLIFEIVAYYGKNTSEAEIIKK